MKPINNEIIKVQLSEFENFLKDAEIYIGKEDTITIRELDIYNTIMWKKTAPIASWKSDENSDLGEYYINKGIRNYFQQLKEGAKNAN